MSAKGLALIAGILWVSAIATLAVGMFVMHSTLVCWVALPDALAALVVTMLAARRWTI